MREVGNLVIRWTVGDVSARGFEALRVSIWGAWRIFGTAAHYVVCVNSLPAGIARQNTGSVPREIVWREVSLGDVPEFIREHIDGAMAEGVAWKFAPLRLLPGGYELALDNDCILWDAPTAIRAWLDGTHDRDCVLAADTARYLGNFADLCGPEPRNSGIRGLPPGLDYAEALRVVLAQRPERMTSETDEQGLQTAALTRAASTQVVSVDEVAICSPFPTHQAQLGRFGAHFVGLNARKLPWEFAGRPASELVAEHWDRHRGELYERVGIPVRES